MCHSKNSVISDKNLKYFLCQIKGKPYLTLKLTQREGYYPLYKPIEVLEVHNNCLLEPQRL